MGDEKTILAIDQGTTGTTVVVFDTRGRTVARASQELPCHFPQPGWVEQEPEQIWASVLSAIEKAVSAAPGGAQSICAIGITNQRETSLVWDRRTGKAVHRALVWQDRRTSARCQELSAHADEVRAITGLVIDPYFSASKVSWLLSQDSAIRSGAEQGSLCMTTVDGFLVQRLTAGRNGRSALIEATNASRTLLMDLRAGTFSPKMCKLWDIPLALLPEIVSSAEVVGHTHSVPGLPDGIPISGIAGDQHAALFGQGCHQPGDVKCTYGTGAFALVNTGRQPLSSSSGLLSTLAWQIPGERIFALEGSCFIAGAAVQWLRDGLGLIESASQSEQLANSVPNSGGVVFVPALTGLGAPYWDADARGLICGLTRGTTAGHVARATLEAIAFQVDDLLRIMKRDMAATQVPLGRLRVDGGACQNNLLMQMQADISGLVVDRPMEIESTARGAALLAGLGVGLFSTTKEAAAAFALDRSFSPTVTNQERESFRGAWEQAVARARS